jgi:hypothetical protein
MPRLSSELKSKTGKEPACHLHYADLLLGLFLNPEDGGSISSEISVDFQLTVQHCVTEEPAIL